MATVETGTIAQRREMQRWVMQSAGFEPIAKGGTAIAA
jgi:hypothetical protein